MRRRLKSYKNCNSNLIIIILDSLPFAKVLREK